MFEFVVDPNVKDQLECLTHAIYHEARSESLKGKLMVGFVIKNRMVDDRWKDSFCGVIEEPYQFSFYDGVRYPSMAEYDAEKASREAAWMVYSSTSPFDECMLYYHADRVTPNWDYTKIDVYEQVDDHVFYVDNYCVESSWRK